MIGRLLERKAPPAADVQRSQSYSLGQMAGLIRYYVDADKGVSIDRALTHAATSACVDVLASSAAALPIDSVEKAGKARLPVEPTPALLESPSGTVDLDVWLYQLLESMLTDGNAFGLVAGVSPMGWPTQIELVDPAIVTERKVEAGVIQAKVGGTVHQAFPHGDLVHVPGKLVRAGSPFAASPIARAAETIATALHARRFGSQFFTDGGHPSTVATVDDPDLTEDQAQTIKEKILAATRGNREPLVVGKDISLDDRSVDPKDSQFLELMRFVIEEACRFFRVPPSMVFAATSGQNVTYANVSQADLHYLKHSLDGYLVRVERKLSLFLPRAQVARFNRGALLRADAETRWKIHDLRLKNKSTSVNEVRAREDETPIDDERFDEPGVPDGTKAERSQTAAEALQKLYLAVGKIITSDEARVLANQVGAGLQLPGPDFTEEPDGSEAD